jgi:hypothetical protein
MHRSRFVHFLQWSVSTGSGHIAVFGTLYAVPMCALFLYLNYDEGSLDVRWALWIIFVSAVSGVVVATLFWFTVMRPLIR